MNLLLTVNSFAEFEKKCTLHFNKPATNLAELTAKNSKKVRGDIFETFAQHYFLHIYTYTNKSEKHIGLKHVWLLREVPITIRHHLRIPKQDVGIDLIGVDDQDRYYAIQVKFRTLNRYKTTTGITWNNLSTFYALVNTTGPWHKCIVFTNAHYCRHMGQKTTRDQSICRGTLMKLTKMDFLKMGGSTGFTLTEASDLPTTSTKSINVDSIREKRLLKFS